MFVTLIDSYKHIGNFSMLDRENYQIQRDEYQGTITIIIYLDNEIFAKTIFGFKKAEIHFDNIDGAKGPYGLVPSDLNNHLIKDILIANKIDPYLVEIAQFEVLNVDNEKGQSEILIASVSDKKLEPQMLNQIFHIINLQPYYIKQVNNLSMDISKMRPSDIKTSEFRKNFIQMSDEFYNRHNDNLQIKLSPDNSNKALHAFISYVDNGCTKQIEFTYAGFDKISSGYIALYVVLGIVGLGGLIVGGYFVYKKLIRKKLNK
jgi:hypothetical protein